MTGLSRRHGTLCAPSTTAREMLFPCAEDATSQSVPPPWADSPQAGNFGEAHLAREDKHIELLLNPSLVELTLEAPNYTELQPNGNWLYERCFDIGFGITIQTTVIVDYRETPKDDGMGVGIKTGWTNVTYNGLDVSDNQWWDDPNPG